MPDCVQNEDNQNQFILATVFGSQSRKGVIVGHEGCCAECASQLASQRKLIDELLKMVSELHTMIFQFAEYMSKLGESPMTRGMLKSMGVKLPKGNGNGGNQ
jgi:type II secretory ATPase GspE/PulE/Tfp pilus assembly ATPase PilB-like protein